MLGGGQLGRMFVSAARAMGYDVIVLDPDPSSPAGSLANEHLAAAYDDTAALDVLARRCAVITTEFENVPAETLEYLARSVPVHPSASALRIAQHRKLEKEFFQKQGLKTAQFIALESDKDLEKARDFPFPAILKTSMLGYDGKGQVVCQAFEDLPSAYDQVGSNACVLEHRVDLACEVSVVLGRSSEGLVSCFPIAENSHANGILDVTAVPASISASQSAAAIDAATRIADGLDYCGVLAVELFITTAGEVLVNEMAPRPHNSGHYTLDACDTSQFEQQVRMVCDLPAGSCRQHTPVAMWNVLGDIWPQDQSPAWQEVLKLDMAKLHLYGKREARPGRKMGHINCLGETLDVAHSLLQQVRNILTRS